MSFLDDEFKRWGEWLDEIWHEVVLLLGSREAWRRYAEIINAREDVLRHGYFHHWLSGMYARDLASAIRRQSEVGPDVATIGRLLERVSRHPKALSRDRYVALYPPQDREIASDHFDELVGRGEQHIDPSVPLDDLKRLRTATRKVKRYVDKNVAHFDRRRKALEFKSPGTFGDLHACLDVLVDLMDKYRLRIQARAMDREVLMPPGWDSIFRLRWIGET